MNNSRLSLRSARPRPRRGSDPYPYQEQPPVVVQNIYQAPSVAAPMMVDAKNSGPGLLARALRFIFVGWWLGYVWALVGYALCFTLVLMPLGVMMLNRLPTVLTLRRV